MFHVFDLVYLDGFNLTRCPLRDRKRVLAELFESVGETSPLRFSDHIEGNGAKFSKRRASWALKELFRSWLTRRTSRRAAATG